MILVIAGSRSIHPSVEDIVKYLERANLPISEITEIVSGRAKGADTAGEEFAKEYHKVITPFPANWKKYGKAAGPIRNAEMADYADEALIIWDGKSTGSKSMISEMTRRGKPAFVIIVGE